MFFKSFRTYNVSQWFKANKLPLNKGKTKFTLFHKPRDKGNLPLQLPNLKINNNEIIFINSLEFWLMKTLLGSYNISRKQTLQKLRIIK